MKMTNIAGVVAGFCAAGVLFAAPAAFAHARLVKASPAADSAVAAPDTIQLQFSEGVEPKFSGFEVTKDGKKVALKAVTFDAKDKTTMTAAPGEKLAPGVYTIDWHTVSGDLHKVQGTLKFTVK